MVNCVYPYHAAAGRKRTSRITLVASILVAGLTLAALLLGGAGRALPVAQTPAEVAAGALEGQRDGSRAIAAAPLAKDMNAASRKDRLRAQLCLTAAIYYEAASESEEGQRAVAQVILNRTRHPAWPATVCGVVYQASDMPVCQFSYSCDGSMARRPDRAHWDKAAQIAEEALAGVVYTPVGLSTFYHTLSVDPIWNREMVVTKVIGNHIFYRLPGRAGSSPAFSQTYAGGEPLPGPVTRRFTPADMARMQLASSGSEKANSGAGARALNHAADDVPTSLSDGDALPQYRDSGRWIGR